MDLMNKISAYVLAGSLGAAVMATPYNAEANERKQIVALMTQTEPQGLENKLYVRDFPLRELGTGILARYNSETGLLSLHSRNREQNNLKVYHFKPRGDSFAPKVTSDNAYQEALNAISLYERFLRVTGLAKKPTSESYVSRAEVAKN
ncbi:hypothetical protein HYU21_00845 [Candidatus Woesearchaeota archaeon]|nr:hypothetical protein [Candidatus Woesearchaeota archaeon]